MMPGLDGFGAAARRCAPTRARAASPVILLSARAGEEARVEGLHAGADDYLVKPFSARELVARVEAQLALARVRREAEAASAPASSAIGLTSWPPRPCRRSSSTEQVPVALPVDAQIDHFYRHAYLAAQRCHGAHVRLRRRPRTARRAVKPAREDPANVEYLRAFVTTGYRLEQRKTNEIGRDGLSRFFVNNLFGIVQDGRLVRAWGSQRDITERRLTLERLRQTQRIERWAGWPAASPTRSTT